MPEENEKEKLDSNPPSPAKVSEGNLGGQATQEEEKLDYNPSATQKEEKLEYLKREEIRTMEKDVKKLREVEAEKERERISNLEAEAKKVKLMPHPKEEMPKEETILSKPPQRPSPTKKILVRIGVILLLFFLLSFFYWYFGIKKPSALEIPQKPPVEKPVEEKIVEKPEIIEKPEIQIPPITERILDWGYYSPTAARTIDTIIIHSVYNTAGGDVYDLEKVIEEYRIHKVAVHYLIARDGTIYRLVPDEAIAYHAGSSRMPDGSRINIINNLSIGIELIYSETESPGEEQYQSLVQLVKYLKQQYNIPAENILGQNQIAPERKTDPWNFDWEKFIQMLKPR